MYLDFNLYIKKINEKITMYLDFNLYIMVYATLISCIA